MDCRRVQEQLNDLIDLEVTEVERLSIGQHLASCQDCRQAHDELLRLKRLVIEKAARPAIPAELRAALIRRSRERRSFLARVWRAAAAAIFTAAGLGLLAVLSIGGPRLKHVSASEGCVSAFRGRLSEIAAEQPLPAAGIAGSWEDEVRAATGAEPERLPRILEADYLGCVTQTIGGVKAIRVDFLTHEGKPGSEPEGRARRLLCLFFLPLRAVDFSAAELEEMERGHFCMECVQMKDGTIYCFRSRDLLINAVSDLEARDLSTYLRVGASGRGR